MDDYTRNRRTEFTQLDTERMMRDYVAPTRQAEVVVPKYRRRNRILSADSKREGGLLLGLIRRMKDFTETIKSDHSNTNFGNEKIVKAKINETRSDISVSLQIKKEASPEEKYARIGRQQRNNGKVVFPGVYGRRTTHSTMSVQQSPMVIYEMPKKPVLGAATAYSDYNKLGQPRTRFF